MGILNDLTGGLAMQFKDAYESIQLTNTGLKGMKAALLATGIGAIVVAIGLISSNWDDIVKSMTAASKEAELQASIAKDLYDMNIEELEIIEASEASLKLQGKTEAEILALKKAETEEAILSLEAHIAAQKLIKDQQVKTAERNQEILKGLLKFITLPIQLILDQVDRLGAIIGKEWDFQDDFNNTVSNLVFDPKKVAQEGEDTIKEMEKTLVGLKGKRDSYELSIQAIDKAAQDKRIADALAEAKRLEEIRKLAEEEDFEDEEPSVEIPPDVQAKMDAHKLEIDNRKQSELEYDEWYDNLMNDQAEDEEKRRQDKTKADADALHQREQITAASFAIASTLNDLFFTKQGKQSKEGFRIAKALALSEAGLNTYKAASAAFATASASPLTLVNPSYPFVQAGIAVAFGAAQIAKIASQTFSGGSAGGGSVSSPSGGGSGAPQGQAPQAALDFSFLQNQQPIQTYVIGSDVKTANEAQQKIKDQSTL
jgi:hypothetical protein